VTDDAAEAREALRARLAGPRSAGTRDRLSGGPADERVSRASAPTPEAPPAAVAVDYLEVKSALHHRLLDEIGKSNLLARGESAVADAVRSFVTRVLDEEAVALNEAERRRLSEDLVEETIGVGPLAPLMADPAVTDILVNGPGRVFVERFGRMEPTDVRFRDDDHLTRVIERIAARIGRRIDVASPMLDARLPDGSRVNATLPPVSIDGPTLSIRRFGRRRLRLAELVGLGELSSAVVEFLGHAVRARRNILVSGGTGAGKSTLLGALAEAIPATERIVTIEDTAELILDQDHVVRLETRPPNVEGRGRITARDLLVNTLRMRPDRIIVGEVRGPEAMDMLQAMNTGHEGGLSTIHANSSRDALARLETMVLMAGLDLPSRAIREQVASAIHLLVHVRRYEDGVRRVESVSEVAGLENSTVLLNEIFRFHHRGMEGRRVVGEFEATGVVPHLVGDLRERRVAVPLSLFARPEGVR